MAQLNTSQELPFTLEIDNSQGTTAPVQGVPVYASSDETVVVVVAAADGMSGTVQAVAASDTPVRVTVTADADLGQGVMMITGVSEDLTVVQDPATQASTFKFTFGPPQPKGGSAPAPTP